MYCARVNSTRAGCLGVHRQALSAVIIAYELGMRKSTVKVHVRNIMKKLRATNRTQVAYMARELMNGKPASNVATRRVAAF
jgi:hypothetical protein